LREAGVLVFRIKTIALSLIPSGMTPSSKNFVTAAIISSFIVPQFLW
jgi:hypothetical protein